MSSPNRAAFSLNLHLNGVKESAPKSVSMGNTVRISSNRINLQTKQLTNKFSGIRNAKTEACY